jgi:soluble lytic murein transglycosylase
MSAASDLLRVGSFDAAASAYSNAGKAAKDEAAQADAALGAGIATYSAGDREGSVELLRSALAKAPAESETARRSAYLLAVRLNDDTGGSRAQSATEALKVLKPYTEAADSDALLPYVLVEYARALDATGDTAGAGATWDRALALPGASSSLRTTVYQQRVAASKAHHDDQATLHWLTLLANATGSSATRYELATLARTTGDTATWAAQLQTIVSAIPGSALAPKAVAHLKAAGYAVDAGQEGLVDYRAGLYDDARTVLTAAINEPGQTPAGLAFRTFYLAAVDEDSGKIEDAVRYYDQAAAIGADSPYTHRAKYWAARVLENSGDVKGASARYVDLVVHGPAGEFTSESAFRAGYTLYKAGDDAGAVAAWNALGVSNDARVLYWKGRAFQGLKDSASANASFAAAVAAGPMDFFGLQAALALGTAKPLDVSYKDRTLTTTIDWTAISTWLNTVVPGALPGSPPTAARDLAAVGLRQRAGEVLLDAADGAGPWRLLELAHEARDVGLTDIAARLAVLLRQATSVPVDQVPRALLLVSYPVDYVEQLSTESKKNGLDPLFVAAMVRQESFWQPDAGSGAGALGLTQVIPDTGNNIAAQLKVAGFVPDDLFRPAVSLQFGAYYLGSELKSYGTPEAALAAYNAGPGNAARWIDTAGPSASPAAFDEDVDIDETQHYVQYIFEHYAAYLKAYG